jgi:chemotaxis protein MotB
MAKKQKKKEDAPDGPGPWMTSYADMVTVLFALFVMLYAMSDVNEERWEAFAAAAAFGSGSQASVFDFAGQGINELMGNGIIDLPYANLAMFQLENVPRGTDVGSGPEENPLEIAAEVLQTYFGDAGLADLVNVHQEGGAIELDFHGNMFFDSGRANVREETFHALDVVAQIMLSQPNWIAFVEGHTDNIPIRGSAEFPDNWALSSARAMNVVRYLEGRGIEGGRLRAIGAGEFSPVDTNETEVGRQRNRRVVIRLYDLDFIASEQLIMESYND